MEQTVIFTALPRSFDPERHTIRVSAHIAPRLDVPGDGFLEPFTDWLDWPATTIDWRVRLGGGSLFEAEVVTDPPARSDLWTSLFKADTFVRSRKDVDTLTAWKVISYPVWKIFHFIQDRYTQLAQTAYDDLPTFDALSLLFGEIGVASPNDRKDLVDCVADLNSELNQTRRNTFDNAAPSMRDFLALKRFLDRGPVDHAFDKLDGKIVAWKPIKPPELDFHQILSLVGGHRRAQRLLGLVVDLEVRLGPTVAASLTGPHASPTDIQVVPSWHSALGDASHDVKPRTRCQFPGGTSFISRPGGTLHNGHLPIGRPPYRVLQMDVDGAGLKLMNFADNLKRSDLRRTDDTPKRYSVPSLRSGGISVIREERADQFVDKLDKGDGINAEILDAAKAVPGPDPFLDAEDVTRGYYVDVWDSKTNEWHSLCRRVGRMRFTAVPDDVKVLPEHGDEAAVTTTPTHSSDPAPPKEMYLQQSLFHWRGWSLAAQQPGKHLQEDGTVDAPDVSTNAAVPLSFEYRVAPHSLPRLRFGVEYRIRMRAADIAGNAVPFDLGATPDDHTLVARVEFARFEPVPSPEVIPRAALTEGESDVRIVIRSNYDTDADGPSERHIVPAKTSQRMAEHHGAFDIGSPSTLDKSAYDLIVARENKTFTDVGMPDPSNPPGSVVVSAPMLPPPYLPDPFARGAAFLGLPGTDVVKTYPFGDDGAWPNYRPFRLVVEEPPGPSQLGPAAEPRFDEPMTPPERALHVQLPKADVVRVRLSSTLLPDDLPKLGVWGWAAPAVAPQVALDGQHWMVTPFRTLTLVHAVRQPLKQPEFEHLEVKRELGQTFAGLYDWRLQFSRKSTGKVELFGTWDEHVDGGPGRPKPAWRHLERTFVVSAKLDRPPKPGMALPDDYMQLDERHEFHDTLHRSITYSMVATTKFVEYFTQRTSLTVQSVPSDTTLDTGGRGLVPGSVSVKDSAGASYVDGQDYTVDDTSGKVTFTSGSLVDKALTLSYVAQPVGREFTMTTALEVPSSARPAAPKVLYAVPTFQWVTGPGTTSRRIGGGLRVYLERPWWSSGDGELLGVVVDRGHWFDPPTRLAPYITQWGLDPIFKGPDLPKRYPGLEHFTLSDESKHGRNLLLDEIPETVHVAGHEVGFDDERDLYYCDIDIDAGSAYMPFVRLALCRYQPCSVPGGHLSRVVLADFAQLAPDRVATVTVVEPTVASAAPTMVSAESTGASAEQSVLFAGSIPPKLHVSLVGVSYASTATGPGSGTAVVTVEERDFTLDEDVGWSAVSDVAMDAIAWGDTTIWSADVTLPGPRSEGRYRLVLQQYEALPTGHPSTFFQYGGEHRARLVHQDILPL